MMTTRSTRSAFKPILSHAKCGCCGSTCEVDDGVRASDTGILGELGMAHSKGLEQITTIQTGLHHRHRCAWHASTPIWKPGKTRCKHNPGPVACVLWHLPVANKTKPSFAYLFNGCQWNCCVSKGEKTSSHTQLSGDVPGKNHLRVNTELFCKVKCSFSRQQVVARPRILWLGPCSLNHLAL